ncbi:DEAD/DEAH box helicase [Bombilactobacillus folatiphilus]|uniref:DEAD/DEAH box helicase n=1 Tax=Bombilactobacillus folatiphilus TaxID=2923362 RepID=A0ABY4PAK2_9LACO|nr:DEAD/DEAH box helicase [Bombilactobacillus folatiphilus]UQS82584.1 DEAD/DEAH box helicase [Bombilactobacillus folatiphilus]
MQIKLYEHQKLALSYLRLNDQFALFMEQGTGKTIPTLVRLLELITVGKAKECLIVAPKSALGAWQRDIELFDVVEQHVLNRHLTLINYDRVWRQSQKSEMDKYWDAIVLDESHFIKNRTSKRAKFLLHLATKSIYRYILTGTPISNGQLENIWSQLTFLKPKVVKGRVNSEIFGSYYDWLDKYALLNQYYQPYRYHNVTELQQIINEHSYRVTKEECLDLPEKLPDEILPIELAEKSYYKELSKDSVISQFEILAENPLSRMLKLRQICSGFVMNDYGDLEFLKTNKLQALNDFLEGFEKKLVIFAEFSYSIDSICQLLAKRKIKYVRLDGSQKNKLIWRDFQSDPSIQVIVVQYQSGATGIDLYAADTTIYYEPTLRSTILEQSRDRTHRTGQLNKCSYIHFITTGTVERQIYQSLANFEDFSEKLFEEYIDHYQKGFYKRKK